MTDIIIWLILGALAGWVASIIAEAQEQHVVILHVAIGLIGALLGGFIMRTIGPSDASGFNLSSFFIAFLGSVVLLFIFNRLSSGKETR